MSGKHPTKLEEFETLEEAAKAVENLRYDALSIFLGKLSIALYQRAASDFKAGRPQLGTVLRKAGDKISDAMILTEEAWTICKPHMDTDE